MSKVIIYSANVLQATPYVAYHLIMLVFIAIILLKVLTF